jgi:hypothetical protein
VHSKHNLVKRIALTACMSYAFVWAITQSPVCFSVAMAVALTAVPPWGLYTRNWLLLSLYPPLISLMIFDHDVRTYIGQILGLVYMSDIRWEASWGLMLISYGFCTATFYLVVRKQLVETRPGRRPQSEGTGITHTIVVATVAALTIVHGAGLRPWG